MVHGCLYSEWLIDLEHCTAAIFHYLCDLTSFSGIHCRRHVTTHGLALNCNVDLKWFDHITPCGLEDMGVTSITQQLNKETTVQDTTKTLTQAFCNSFNCTAEEQPAEVLYDICGVKLE